MTDKEQKEIFSRNLNKYVSESGKSQKEICKDLGIGTTTFNMWCKGNSMPSVRKIQELADYFNIAKSSLVDKDAKKVPTFSNDHIEIIEMYDSLDDKNRERLMNVIRIFAGFDVVKKDFSNDAKIDYVQYFEENSDMKESK